MWLSFQEAEQNKNTSFFSLTEIVLFVPEEVSCTSEFYILEACYTPIFILPYLQVIWFLWEVVISLPRLVL